MIGEDIEAIKKKDVALEITYPEDITIPVLYRLPIYYSMSYFEESHSEDGTIPVWGTCSVRQFLIPLKGPKKDFSEGDLFVRSGEDLSHDCVLPLSNHHGINRLKKVLKKMKIKIN